MMTHSAPIGGKGNRTERFSEQQQGGKFNNSFEKSKKKFISFAQLSELRRNSGSHFSNAVEYPPAKGEEQRENRVLKLASAPTAE